MDEPYSPPSAPAPPPGSRPAPRSPGEAGVSLPLPAFRALTAPLRRGGPAATAALREAGRTTGEALFEDLDGDEALPPADFWDRVRRLTDPAGLGTPDYGVLAPGIGSVTITGGAEVRGGSPGACHFAAGWIGGLLSEAAGEPVAVLEVRCASLGPGDGCRFLVGSAARLRRIRRRLSDGASLSAALRGDGAGEESGEAR